MIARLIQGWLRRFVHLSSQRRALTIMYMYLQEIHRADDYQNRA
jgi:hypothetical protein